METACGFVAHKKDKKSLHPKFMGLEFRNRHWIARFKHENNIWCVDQENLDKGISECHPPDKEDVKRMFAFLEAKRAFEKIMKDKSNDN